MSSQTFITYQGLGGAGVYVGQHQSNTGNPPHVLDCGRIWEPQSTCPVRSSFLNPNEMFDPNISSGQGHSSILHIAPRLRGYCAKRGITGGSTKTSVASRFFSALSPVCLTIAGRAAYGQCEEAVR